MICERYKQVLIKPHIPLREAIKQMDKAALQVLIVIDNENRLLGMVTDGDVRRGILNGIDLEKPVEIIMNKNPVTIFSADNKKEILQLMKKFDIRHIPVVDKENKVVGLILWKDLFNNSGIVYPTKDTPVIIMAGGKGKRLDPFTRILPKALIPIGKKAIIEIIMDNFKKYGFNKFFITINYKAEMIKSYFSENSNNYKIKYIQEKRFLGTAGALSLAKDKLLKTFIVSNCDVIIDVDFDEVLAYHKENNNKATIIGVVRYLKIPYGILKIQNGNLDKFMEKPEYYFIANSGIYILEPEVIDLIPRDRPIDMPDVLTLAKKKKLKIQVYPVSCAWFDVGEWKEYKKAVEYINI